MASVMSMNLFGNAKTLGGPEVTDFILQFVKTAKIKQPLLGEMFLHRRSYWFAYVLKASFGRGEILKSASFNGYTWRDTDGQCYTITGAYADPHASLEKLPFSIETPQEFISSFVGEDEKQVQVLQTLFGGKYCWHFAHILQEKFNRGKVCLAIPEGRVVWMNEDGTLYTIYGVYSSECLYCIPERFFGKELDVLRCTLSKDPSVMDMSIQRLIENYERKTGAEGGLEAWNARRNKACGNSEVLLFIQNFVENSFGNAQVVSEVFSTELTFEFAVILKAAFERGTLVLSTKSNKFAWRDEDGVCYDINGVVDASTTMVSYEGTTSEESVEDYIIRMTSKEIGRYSVLVNIFTNGYSWALSHILQEKFGGTVVLSPSVGLIVWLDVSEVAYNVYGRDDSEIFSYIPEDIVRSVLGDYRKNPALLREMSDDKIVEILSKYEAISGETDLVNDWLSLNS